MDEEYVKTEDLFEMKNWAQKFRDWLSYQEKSARCNRQEARADVLRDRLISVNATVRIINMSIEEMIGRDMGANKS